VTLKKCVFLLGLGLWAALVVPSFGQNLGEITGVISDASNALVAGATVTVSSPTTGFTRQAVTNTAGNFDFPGLQPGIYNIKAEAPGFGAETRTNVELQVQQVERIDFQLKVGTVSESVEVSAGAPLLNTESADVGTVVETKRIEDLPLNGRDFLQRRRSDHDRIVHHSPGRRSHYIDNFGLGSAPRV
jgi:hypothetical protein